MDHKLRYELERRTRANEQAAAIDRIYREATASEQARYDRSVADTGARYQQSFAANAVSDTLTRTNAANALSGTHHPPAAHHRSGNLSATADTALSLSHSRADSKVSAQKQQAVDRIMQEWYTLKQQYQTQAKNAQIGAHAAVDADIRQYHERYDARKESADQLTKQYEAKRAQLDREMAWQKQLLEQQAEARRKAAQAARQKPIASTPTNTSPQPLFASVGNIAQTRSSISRQFQSAGDGKDSTILSPSQQEHFNQRAGGGRYDVSGAFDVQVKRGLNVQSVRDTAYLVDMTLDEWDETYTDIRATYQSGEWCAPTVTAAHLQKLSDIGQALSNAIAFCESEGLDSGLIDTLRTVEKQVSDTVATVRRLQDEYAQYDSAADYDKATLQKEQESEDLEAGARRLRGIEQDMETVAALGRAFMANFKSPKADTPEMAAERKLIINTIVSILSEYGITIDLSSERDIPYAADQAMSQLYSQGRAYYNRCVYVQKDNALEKDALAASDFDEKSRFVERDDAQYRRINTPEKQNGNRSYDFMTDEEIAVYNYYYATGGKDAAKEYLYAIEEQLNDRKANKNFEAYDDRHLKEILFGAAAGFDQFATGIKHLFNTDDSYIPQNATQMTADLIREDLAENNDAALFAYDVLQSVSNAAPSALLAIGISFINPIAGGIVGATLSGASSAGHAYAEAINKGLAKGEARVYSTLVGASESLLQYALGGISAFGGTATYQILSILDELDCAFTNVAKALGGMASEGLEEVLQDCLTPVFENIVVGGQVNTAADLDWEQLATSFLLGAVTSGITNGVTKGIGKAVDTVKLTKFGKGITDSGGAQALIDFGKTFPEGSEVKNLAQSLDVNAGHLRLGKLAAAIMNSRGDVRTDLHKLAAEETKQENTNDANADVSTENPDVGNDLRDVPPDDPETLLDPNLSPEVKDAAVNLMNELDAVNPNLQPDVTLAFLDGLNGNVDRIIDSRGKPKPQVVPSAPDADTASAIADFFKGFDGIRSIPQNQPPANPKSPSTLAFLEGLNRRTNTFPAATPVSDPVEQIGVDENTDAVYNQHNEAVIEQINNIRDDVQKQQQNVNAVAKPTVFKCVNQSLKNKRHPVTDVLFVERTVAIDGQQYIVVVPQFDSLFDAQLPDDLRYKSDSVQFRNCNKQMYQAIQQDPSIGNRFTKDQLDQLAHSKTPDGYTWHHDAEVGRMQLISTKMHDDTGHTGGRALWGGGEKGRRGKYEQS